MTISSEWKHQTDVDRAADAILDEGKVTLETITAYQVAARLDRSANPSLYAKFRDWRSRREAEAAPAMATIDVPPEVEAGIRAIFDRLSGEGINACLKAVRDVGSNLDRVMMLRVTVAERRADKAAAETTEVLAIGQRAEEELRVVSVRLAELERTLADAQRREDRLTGRLEQYEADLAVALRHHPHNDAPTATPPMDVSDAAAEDADASGAAEPGDAGHRDDGDVASAHPVALPTPDRRLPMTLQRSDRGDDAG